jgi:hypothetical protein
MIQIVRIPGGIAVRSRERPQDLILLPVARRPTGSTLTRLDLLAKAQGFAPLITLPLRLTYHGIRNMLSR